MVQATRTWDDFLADLETLGEEKVRSKLALGDWGDTGQRRGLVEEWLRSRDQSRLEVASFEQKCAARTANIAAIVAATAAVIAAICAIISIVPLLR